MEGRNNRKRKRAQRISRKQKARRSPKRARAKNQIKRRL
jgi:hypothetical protein